MTNTTKYQFVGWFPEWVGFRYVRPTDGMQLIYEWCVGLGFWEIRKWKRQ